MAEGVGARMSIEIRHVIEGDCDCGTPKFSWEHSDEHGHYWECEYGRIPSFDINNPAPLVISARDWTHRLLATCAPVRVGSAFYEVTSLETADGIRLFQRLEHHRGSWTWELLPAHWADPPTRHNVASAPIYLGRWPD